MDLMARPDQKSPRKSPEEVYEECKRFFSCRFLYLLGPPGAPVEQMAGTLEKQYGYSAINLTTLLRTGGPKGVTWDDSWSPQLLHC